MEITVARQESFEAKPRLSSNDAPADHEQTAQHLRLLTGHGKEQRDQEGGSKSARTQSDHFILVQAKQVAARQKRTSLHCLFGSPLEEILNSKRSLQARKHTRSFKEPIPTLRRRNSRAHAMLMSESTDPDL